MDAAEALNLINELVQAEVDVVKQVNSQRGLTQRAEKREDRAVQAIFTALVGRPASIEEIKSATTV